MASTRRKLFPLWVPLLFGLLGLARVFGNPRLAAIRTVDIVQLLGTGMCLGVAIAGMATLLQRPRE